MFQQEESEKRKLNKKNLGRSHLTIINKPHSIYNLPDNRQLAKIQTSRSTILPLAQEAKQTILKRSLDTASTFLSITRIFKVVAAGEQVVIRAIAQKQSTQPCLFKRHKKSEWLKKN